MAESGNAREWVNLLAPSRIDQAGDVRFFSPPPGTARILMDLTEVEWIAPIGIVGLLALMHRAVRDGFEALQIVPSQHQHVWKYLAESGFVSLLESRGVQVEAELREGMDQPVRPLLTARFVQQESEMERAANALWHLLDQVHAPPEIIQGAYDVMAEVTNNAREHGEGCYVMAQTHTGFTSGTPGAQIAVADLGPGFAATLAAYAPTSELDAIMRAFEEGVTGTKNPYRGQGLGYVRDAIDSCRWSSLSIISGDAWVERSGGHFVERHGPDCGGVFVTAYFPFNPA